MFALVHEPIDAAALEARLADPAAGGVVIFAGIVRNHHQGKAVSHLDYHSYEAMARRVGERIVAEARTRWPLMACVAVHRLGRLHVGDAAVWVGVSAAHRDAAFAACRFVIDAIKERVPVWKHEFAPDGSTSWVEGVALPEA
jgi:molybdopterin synthase catalytic subunit